MVALYAVATVIGVIALIGWIGFGMFATSVTDGDRFDPELRFGSRGRMVVAAVLGLGLAGMSASFAGWSDSLAVVGAIAGAVAAVLVGNYLGVEEDGDPG